MCIRDSFKHMIGLDDNPVEAAPFKINVLGEYNIGGDAWEIDTLLRKCGITVLATLSGGVTYDEITSCHQADLNSSCVIAPSITWRR